MTIIAAATGHPLATAAALEIGSAGGNAVDAAIAAQAVLCVVLPQSAGLGGDALALVDDGNSITGINGTGRSPAEWTEDDMALVGNHVTVPGGVSGWFRLNERYGQLSITDLLAPAEQICRAGILVDEALMAALDKQRERLVAVSPDDPLLAHDLGDLWVQEQTADLLSEIAGSGPGAFYSGACAQAIERAVTRHGGALRVSDLEMQTVEESEPISVPWNGGTVAVQPPSSQGVLLAAALEWLDSRHGQFNTEELDHVMVELTGAVFEWRDDCALGRALLGRDIAIDSNRAVPRRGPRAYLHTAGVATADENGLVVSSLVSVFDNFGSGIWVPEVGIRLNNRAGGFTAGRNAPRPGARPVHTLAPSIVHRVLGDRVALATPGADGQVQTLLQVLAAERAGTPLQEAIAADRWRSQDGAVILPPEHSAAGALETRGHKLVVRESSSELYGAVVCAGVGQNGPYALADWRRQTAAGISS